MKKLLKKWEQETQTEIEVTANIIAENYGAYGSMYRETLEYAWLNQHYENLKFKRTIIQSILKLWR